MSSKKLSNARDDPDLPSVKNGQTQKYYGNSVVNGFNSSKFRLFEQNSDEKVILANILNSLFKGGQNLIDVGAGTGSLTAKLLGNGRKIVAIEPCADFHSLLHEKLGDNNPILCTSFENAEIKKGNADGIIFSHSLYYIQLSSEIFSKIRDSLREGGVVAFILFAPSGDQYDISTELDFSGNLGTPIFRSRYFDLKHYFDSRGIQYSESLVESHFRCEDKDQLVQALSFMLGIDTDAVMRNWKSRIMHNRNVSILLSTLEAGNHALISTDHAIFTVGKGELEKL